MRCLVDGLIKEEMEEMKEKDSQVLRIIRRKWKKIDELYLRRRHQ